MNNFKYCSKCEDETLHDGEQCRRCINEHKVFVNIPMVVLDTMVHTYKMSVDEAIDGIVKTVRAEIKKNYELWLAGKAKDDV